MKTSFGINIAVWFCRVPLLEVLVLETTTLGYCENVHLCLTGQQGHSPRAPWRSQGLCPVLGITCYKGPWAKRLQHVPWTHYGYNLWSEKPQRTPVNTLAAPWCIWKTQEGAQADHPRRPQGLYCLMSSPVQWLHDCNNWIRLFVYGEGKFCS